MLDLRLVFVIFLGSLLFRTTGAADETIDFNLVQQAAKNLGEELWQIGEIITRRKELQESFSSAKVANRSGSKLAEEISRDLKQMMDIRINAVKRIVKAAEELPRGDSGSDDFYDNYKFYNSRDLDKTIKNIDDEKQRRINSKDKQDRVNETSKFCEHPFDPNRPTPTVLKSDDQTCMARLHDNLNFTIKESSVFFPVDVFDNNHNITRIVHRSEGLNKAFVSNYERDPTVGWQFFCNSSGLFRHYPPTVWNFQPVNMYDCRMRNWYTGTATSAKDIIILIEKSGSITGSRLGIATEIVRNILDTLTPNDFVNVFKFSDKMENLVNCFNNTLVQANSANIFEFKQALHNIKTTNQTDLVNALNQTFKILQKYRKDKGGGNCNQAIMIITDGMEYTKQVKDLFKEYNWNENYPVRVFTFLIGIEIPIQDYEQIKLMACENQGYYVQIDTSKEVREQVLNYIPVMARPLIMHGSQNPIQWSTIYADIHDSYRITNQEWNCRQRENQRRIVTKYLINYPEFSCIDTSENEIDTARKFVFVTTVAMPAYEKGGNNSMLLGVAGVDVPIFEFDRLLQPFLLGVGGYAFIVDHNGNIVTHPDFRPIFQQNILKPAFNSIDMIEVELMDDGKEARDFNELLLEIRKAIINQTTGSKYMYAKQFYDDMKRATRLKRNYYWIKIGQSPFTLVVTFPEHYAYRVQVPEEEVDSKFTKGSNILNELFNNRDYRLHPKWVYCKIIYDRMEEIMLGVDEKSNDITMTPEEELEYFLERFEQTGWKWRSDKFDKDRYRCDRRLMRALIYDAKVTNEYPFDYKKKPKDKGKELVEKLGVSVSFIATHSGLLRYVEYDNDNDSSFGDSNNRGVDEIWYKRAVELNHDDPQSFIYSVPFDVGNNIDTQVTASHAIHVRDGQRFAPIAVVGYKFAHSAFANLFEKIMGNCLQQSINNKCFILDNHAYIVSSNDPSQTGTFFGAAENYIMQLLIEERVYKPISVYDYQAVCYVDKNIDYEFDYQSPANGAASILLWTPIDLIQILLTSIFMGIWNFPALVLAREYIENLMYPDDTYYFQDEPYDLFCRNKEEETFTDCCDIHFEKTNTQPPKNFPNLTETELKEDYYVDCVKRKNKSYNNCVKEFWNENLLKRHFNRTRATKCDKMSILYTLINDKDMLSIYEMPSDGCLRPFVIQRIAHSNLILLVANGRCRAPPGAPFYEFYNNPMDIVYNDTLSCRKQQNQLLYRRHSKHCFNFHEDESKINDSCGLGNRLHFSTTAFVLTLIANLLPQLQIRPIFLN